MNTQKMRYLLKIADLGSITEAAAQLYVSQPALSQVVAYMEQKYNIKIFSRKDRKLVLTTEGSILIDAIRRELIIEDNMERQLADVKSEYSGKLTVGMSLARSAQLLPEILPDFFQAYPGITLHISTNLQQGLENLVIDGKVDFAFVMDIAVISPAKKEQLVFEPLFPYHALLAVPPTHELVQEAGGILDWNKRPPVNLLRVKDEPFILQKYSERNALYTKKIFYDYGFEPKVRMVIDNEVAIANLVLKGVGFAIIQEHVALMQEKASCIL